MKTKSHIRSSGPRPLRNAAFNWAIAIMTKAPVPIRRGTLPTSHWTRFSRPPKYGLAQVSFQGTVAPWARVDRAQYQALTAQKTMTG